MGKENNLDEGIQTVKPQAKSSSKKEVVNKALKNYVFFLKRKEILSFRGDNIWTGDLDSMRSN
jgi:Arc/MetJ family transcription regulator